MGPIRSSPRFRPEPSHADVGRRPHDLLAQDPAPQRSHNRFPAVSALYPSGPGGDP